MSYREFLNNGYESFRKWFNANFKLDINGHFCGLQRLIDLNLLHQFIRKLERYFNRRQPSDVVIKLNFRNAYRVKVYMF